MFLNKWEIVLGFNNLNNMSSIGQIIINHDTVSQNCVELEKPEP